MNDDGRLVRALGASFTRCRSSPPPGSAAARTPARIGISASQAVAHNVTFSSGIARAASASRLRCPWPFAARPTPGVHSGRSPSRRAAALPVPAGRPGNDIAASSCRFAQFGAQPIAIAKMCIATLFLRRLLADVGSVTYWTVLPG